MIDYTVTIPDTDTAREDIEARAAKLREAFLVVERKKVKEAEATVAPSVLDSLGFGSVPASELKEDGTVKKRGRKPKQIDEPKQDLELANDGKEG